MGRSSGRSYAVRCFCMTDCIICHKTLDVYSLRDIDFESRRGKRLRDIDFVCICFDCIKKQNKN